MANPRKGKTQTGDKALLVVQQSPGTDSPVAVTDREFGPGAVRYNQTTQCLEESTQNGTTVSWHTVAGWRGLWVSGSNYGTGQFVIDTEDNSNIYECTVAVSNSTERPSADTDNSNWTKRITVSGGSSSGDGITETTSYNLTASVNAVDSMLNKYVLVGPDRTTHTITCQNSLGADGDKIIFGNASRFAFTMDINATWPDGVSGNQSVRRRQTATVRKFSGRWWHVSDLD